MDPVPGLRRRTRAFRGPDGHLYHLNKFLNGGRISFRCAKYRSARCFGRASCDDQGRNVKLNRLHNHPSELQAKEIRILIHALKMRSKADQGTDLEQIYQEERRRLRISHAAAALYPYVRVRNAMLRARRRGLPDVPHSITALGRILKQRRYASLTATINGHDSIYRGTFGKTADRTRCIIFASKRQLRYLRRVKRAFCDATFKSVPAGLHAHQLWNLSTVRRRKVLGLVRVLMQSKKAACHDVALSAIQRLQPRFDPATVNLDYDKGQKKSFRNKFPRCRRRGCLFHFTKNVIKVARQMNLAVDMLEDEEIFRLVRMVCALPLLETGRIERGLHLIGRRAVRKGKYAVMGPFLEKMAEIWLAPSVLPILSVHGAKDRTSNACESDNAEVARLVKAPHPNVYKFLSGLVELEEKTMQNIATLEAGRTPNRAPKAETLANDAVIQSFTEDLREGNIGVSRFLRCASRRLQGTIEDMLAVERA